MVIKVLFVVLILSTAAMVAVGIAIYLRVRRHLGAAHTEAEMMAATEPPDQDDKAAHIAEAFEEDNHGKSGDRDTSSFG